MTMTQWQPAVSPGSELGAHLEQVGDTCWVYELVLQTLTKITGQWGG